MSILARKELTPTQEVLHFGDPRIRLKDPFTSPTYYQKTVLSPGIRETIQNLGGDSLVFACGYGSAFAGGASSTSRVDFMMIVGDLYDFHRRNIESGVLKYGNKKPEHHVNLGKSGLNYYHGETEIEGKSSRIKVGLMGLDVFLDQSKTFGLDPSHMYIGGRFHKAGLVPIVADSPKQHLIDQAINNFRWGGVQLGLAAVPQEFSGQQLIEEMINGSYRADFRLEKWHKHLSIFLQNPEGYGQMVGSFISTLTEKGFIEKTEMGYRKLMALGSDEVARWMFLQCKPRFIYFNYIKNLQTTGLSGIQYAGEKVVRVIWPLVRPIFSSVGLLKKKTPEQKG